MLKIKWPVLISILLLVASAANAGDSIAAKQKSAKAAKPKTAKPVAVKSATPGEIERISVDELIVMLAKNRPVTIIDVRNTDSYDTKIKGALQIPHEQVASRLKEIPRTREIVTYCA